VGIAGGRANRPNALLCQQHERWRIGRRLPGAMGRPSDERHPDCGAQSNDRTSNLANVGGYLAFYIEILF
jgi:hypothetical protein